MRILGPKLRLGPQFWKHRFPDAKQSFEDVGSQAELGNQNVEKTLTAN
jgi:hypothetical protein